MKAYTYSHETTNKKILTIDQISKLVKKYGFSVLADTPKGKQTNLDEADVFIVEVSVPSTRAGYVIAYAIACRKPILCLHHAKLPKSDLEYLTEGASEKLLTLKAYDEKSINDVLSFYLRQKKKKEIVTTKFTLRVPPTIAEYLKWKKQFTSKSKASIIRDGFIENTVEKDELYQDYLRKRSF